MCHQRLLEVFFCSNESFDEKMVIHGDSVICKKYPPCENLGGGFKYVLFSPLFGEDVQFD